jgi:putative transposase
MEKAFSYRFYPTAEQESLLRQTLGCVRLVYNRALAARTEAWYERQERIDYVQSSAMLTGWKKQADLQFLNEVSSVPLQQGLRHLQAAFSNFFACRAKYPNFKKKHNGGSAEFTKSAFKWKDGKLFLAKCTEPLNIRWSRQLPDGVEPSTVTVRLNPAGQWYVSLRFKDHLHKLTTRLIRENQTIAVESLAVKNMVKNHKLARAISDAGWGELVRQLEYKAKWYGRDLVTIDKWFPSSKRCGNCGHVLERLPLKVREWDCPNCGTHHDRDINATKNILAVGHTVQVCGANVRPDRHKLGGQLRKSSNGKKQKT